MKITLENQIQIFNSLSRYFCKCCGSSILTCGLFFHFTFSLEMTSFMTIILIITNTHNNHIFYLQPRNPMKFGFIGTTVYLAFMHGYFKVTKSSTRLKVFMIFTTTITFSLSLFQMAKAFIRTARNLRAWTIPHIYNFYYKVFHNAF